MDRRIKRRRMMGKLFKFRLMPKVIKGPKGNIPAGFEIPADTRNYILLLIVENKKMIVVVVHWDLKGIVYPSILLFFQHTKNTYYKSLCKPILSAR